MKYLSYQHIAAAALTATAVLCASPAGAQQIEKVPAFPGAEGFGRYTTGGRGGNVYHVTNLDDSGTGSLRWALSQNGPRTIVFDVSGTIRLRSALRIGANTTIAGQTAPGDGICIANYPVSVGSNCIVRYMRFRLGNAYVTEDGADGWDGLSAMDNKNIIIDHCSVSWSIDECCSVLGNSNSTLQWSIVSQSLVDAGHSKGNHGYGGNWGGSGASFHHNLVAHHGSRTPRLGPRQTTQTDERMDMRNNVIYNFGGNGCYGGEGMNVNIVNNYYKPGPASPADRKGRRIAGVGIRTVEYCLDKENTVKNIKNATGQEVKSSLIYGKGDAQGMYLTISGTRYDIDKDTETIVYDGKTVAVAWNGWKPMLHVWGTFYVEGNVNPKYANVAEDNWANGMYNQIDTSVSATDGTWSDEVKENLRLQNPVDFIATTTHTADVAYERVLDYAGASLSRDALDALIVSDTRDGAATYTGKDKNGKDISKGLINSPDDLRPADAGADWSAWPTLNSTIAPVDTDGDGIPDEWEVANGLDPANRHDGNTYTDDGYTMLEVYLASLVEEITEAQNAGGTVEGYIDGYDIKDCYEISNDTREESAWSFGNGISLSNNDKGSYTTNGSYVGCGRDIQHTISLPLGVEIRWIRFEGKGRYTTSSYTDASLVELNGCEYASGVYALPKTAEGGFDIALPQPARNNITMTWTGNNPYFRALLYTTENPGLEGINSAVMDPREADDCWYNLQGIRIACPDAPGLYIRNGRKVLVK